MKGGFADRVALVTGGSRGIGRAIALDLARAGAEVVVAATTLERAERTRDEILDASGRARALAIDVADEDSVDTALRGLLGDYDIVPLLVNNAGITRDNLLLRMKSGDWRDVIETNLSGVFRICRALVPGMVRSRFGRIVNVTSVVAGAGNPGQTNYAAAKAGVQGFSRSLARELASRNITVNCVAPGFIETDMTRDLPRQARERLEESIPLKRLGRPEDIVGCVRFLLSEDAGYITGTTLHVNGGMYM